MNVTLVPEQIVDPVLLAILTAVVTDGFTVIVIALLFAEDAVTHVNEVVRLHVTTSVLAKVEEL